MISSLCKNVTLEVTYKNGDIVISRELDELNYAINKGYIEDIKVIQQPTLEQLRDEIIEDITNYYGEKGVHIYVTCNNRGDRFSLYDSDTWVKSIEIGTTKIISRGVNLRVDIDNKITTYFMRLEENND